MNEGPDPEQLLLYLQSKGREGNLVFGGIPWPRIDSRFFASREQIALIVAMSSVAEYLARRLRDEPYKLVAFSVKELTVFAHISIGGTDVMVSNLANRALDFLLKGDRDDGILDPEIISDNFDAHMRKLVHTTSSILAFCDAFVEQKRLMEQGGSASEENTSKLVAEALKKRGVDNYQFRVAEANPGQPQKEVVAAIKQKPWIHTGGPE